ncbi:MAG: nuclear transport factor 2 family protein [Mitsuaria chitosanitabida]|uniref:YybH family protein n=1 Tax=Roseateles chitosanitabidus TaxID=65048 RepID=UPI001AFF76ED|nr:nuclear transport factor 2 family protein [Roseateles chitosanitabidus]MBO9685798.1 nuclear transport factor 2 family protein [Roseateles chitosanitabidus]
MSLDPVHAFLRDYAAAVHDRDLERFMALYADDLQVFDSWSTWEYRGADPWRQMAAAWFGGLGDERVRVTASEVVSWVDTQVAGGSATWEFAAIDPSGKPLRSIENRLTVLLRKDGPQWRVVHQHTSVPIDFGTKHVARPSTPT